MVRLPHLYMVPSTGSSHVFMILFWFSINFLYGLPATFAYMMSIILCQIFIPNAA